MEYTPNLSYQKFQLKGQIHPLPTSLGLKSSKQKCQAAIKKGEALIITALDSLAWITNCRGYQFPFSSTFAGTGIATEQGVDVLVGPGFVPKQTPEGVRFHACSPEEREKKLTELLTNDSIKQVIIDPQSTNYQDYLMLQKLVGTKIQERKESLIPFQSIKTAEEQDIFRQNFRKGDQAITSLIRWVKQKTAEEYYASEAEIFEKTTEFYRQQGMVEHSFHTIVGVGANSSIIHYGSPTKTDKATKDKVVLLDSGGYFEGGYATDTTRTFCAGDPSLVDPRWKEIYTLVLKGTLRVQSSCFPVYTQSSYLDALAREALYLKGKNFGHGTGHGVGISVHEPGVNIRSEGGRRYEPGQVVSIEPGLYIPGFGGVRIENIGLIVPHPQFENYLCFEPLVFIGFEPGLIIEEWLSPQEREHLEWYEARCQERGTSFREI